MKVLVATVGGSEEPVIVAARKLGLDRAILITGKPASEVFDEPVKDDVDPIRVSERIGDKLRGLGAEVEIIPVNPFDFEECCIKTLEAIEKVDEDVNVIISGGTKIQALAASYAAFVCGCRMFYAQETKEGSELVEIPLTFSEVDELTSSRRSVLKVLEDGGTAESVAEKLGSKCYLSSKSTQKSY